MAETLRAEIEERVLLADKSAEAALIAGEIWDLLEDRLGQVQDKLFRDLHNTREELKRVKAERDRLALAVIQYERGQADLQTA
jgi:hypothetical protein